MAYQPSIDTWTSSGSLAAADATFTVDALGSASATIRIHGTFDGSITITGGSSTNPAGGRPAFKSGVGSLGRNVVDNDGSAIDNEYRIVSGGEQIKLTASSTWSGTANIEIVATRNASTVFVNGPVHTAIEEATRAGRAYNAGTGTQAVSNNNFLKFRFANPGDSGVNMFLFKRLFSTNETSSLPELNFFPSEDALAGTPTSVTPINLDTGSALTFAADCTWIANTTSLGTPDLAQILPLNGVPYAIEIERKLSPGSSFAYQIAGSGGGLQNSLRAAMSFIWYEEDVN